MAEPSLARASAHRSAPLRAWLARLFARRIVLAAAVLLGAMLVMAALGDALLPQDAQTIVIGERLQAPSARHWAGTDEMGRDIGARIAMGARYSLGIGAATALLAVAAGTLLGLLGGFFRALDAPLMRLVDALMAFPDILLGIALVAILGASPSNVVLALGLVYTPRVARVVRACTLVIRELTYVEAARAAGIATPRILARHVLPNLMSPLMVQLTFVFAYALLAEAGLSFLGVGVGAEIPTWGTMIASSTEYADRALWTLLFPGLAIVCTAMSLQLLGDGVRDTLDPRLRGQS